MNKIPVFYSGAMVADSQSASPSAAKPVKVVASWARQFPIHVIDPLPVLIEDLQRTHDPFWVEGVLGGKFENGFGNKSLAVAASLRYTSGSMLTAARYVLAGGGPVAAAPCSGFHHAGYKQAQGFCTFNGLMVTAMALRAERPDVQVGILDFDMHYGNGTHDLIQRHKCEYITHFTAGKHFFAPNQVEQFFKVLRGGLLDVFDDCHIVLYQAGADPHIDDPYGGWLTTGQMRERDAIVFDKLAEFKVPVVWNLAGGYQVQKDGSIPKVLEIHDNTMRECVRVYANVDQ